MPSERASFLAAGSAFPLPAYADALSNFPVISAVLARCREKSRFLGNAAAENRDD